MATFTKEVNRFNDQLYDGLADYNKALKQSLLVSSTVNNPLGKTCQITFGSLDLNFNFFNLAFQKSPLNFNLFNKFEKASNIVSDVNSTFIKMIEDLECCDLAKNYNNNILPLFMWFIGDSGDSYSHPKQYDSSRKSSGFLPILIEVAEGLMKAYEPVKTLTCIVRPVPGNPWAEAGGSDFLKPIYNVMSELDFVMKTLLNGEYLDILIEPMKHFRDQVTQCNGKNRSKLQMLDASNLMTEEAIHQRDYITQITSDYATKLELTSTKPPVQSEKYFEVKTEVEDYTQNKIKWGVQISQYNMELSNIELDKTKNLKDVANYSDQKQKILDSLTDLEIKGGEPYDKAKSELVWVQNQIDSLGTAFNDLIDKEGKLKNLIEELTIKLSDTEYKRLKNELEVEDELYQIQLRAYDDYKIFSANALNTYKDCTLMTKALIGARTENSCSCLLSLLNIFVALPEYAQIKSDDDIDLKLIGRLPFSEADKYKQNDYTLISRSNLSEKFPGVPTLLYPGVLWRNDTTGVLPSTEMTDTLFASDFYIKIDAASTLQEAVSLSTILLTYKQQASNKKLKIDLELSNELDLIIEKLKSLKIKKIEELIKIDSIASAIESTAFILDYTNQTFNPIGTDYSGNTIYSNSINDQVQLKQDLVVIEDLLSLPTVDYITTNISKISNDFDISLDQKNKLLALDKQSTDLDKNINDWASLIKLNTRVVIILSKDNVPCDCNIICRLIQYVVDAIINAVKDMFNRLVDMILNSVMTKEMAYILRFVRAKLQCLVDVLAIPENIKLISDRAKDLIEEMQMKLQYASEPAFCLNTPDTTPASISNSVIPVNTTTTSNIQKPLINYNIDGPGSGEQYFDNNGVDSTTSGAYPYPSTSGTVYPIDITTVNNNKLIIKNVRPGQQYQFRNIPTLFFDCNIPDPSLRPVFDIVTDHVPNIWSCYFSFSLTAEKLNKFTNLVVYEQLSTGDQKIKDLVIQELNTDITPSINLWSDIDVQSVIAAAKEAAKTTIPDQFKQKVQECTTDTVLTDTGTSTCGYHHLEFVSAELLNPLVNNQYINFTKTTTDVEISLKNDESRFNVPIKVKVKKILEDPAKNLVFNEYNPEQVSVILLIDLYSSGTIDLSKGVYDKKPEFDINLFYGRYPYLEIGYKDSSDGHYYLPDNVVTSIIDYDTLLNLCDKALMNRKTVDAANYQPTPEQIAKRKEIIQDRWEQNPCYLPTEARDAIENNKETVNNIIKPLLLDFADKLNAKTEWIITQTPVIDNTVVQQITNSTQKTIEYGIPLLELDRDKKICVQIIQVKTIENGIDVYKPMVNISNFNFLSDLLNINDNNNIQTIIVPDTIYFMCITFDGSKYQFTLIDENKVKSTLTKLKTTSNSLFPTRFGRMTNQELVDQTFCGTLFDLGIANTVINPELYYKYSLLNFNPHSEIFIDFETNIHNNFYSSSDLPMTQLNGVSFTPEVRSYLEQTYLKEYGQVKIPYYIYNKYISAQPMNVNLVIEGNKFKNSLKESFITNFFCKESIKNKSFTLSFWFKRLSNEFIPVTSSRMVMVSDTKYFNNFYYDESSVEFVIELNDKNQIIRIPKFLQVGIWNNLIIKFDHLLNRLNVYITNENENMINQIYVGTLNHQFDFNLISMLAEFDYTIKDFTNFFPCLFGNLIVDTTVLSDQILNESFPLQKLAFQGL